MEKKIIELFAGVGGFRLGFEKSSKEWNTVWANQWEPGKKSQHAFDCYKLRFENHGGVNEFSNTDIAQVHTDNIPDHSVLVGGFPCQDYSVAGTKAQGLEGKKGVLWWEIDRILKNKKTPFALLENVDRLVKSPASQRGRDFAIMLSALNNNGYGVEWRVINAEDYGLQQRRRRIFIFAFKNNTKYYKQIKKSSLENIMLNDGMFAKQFPIINDFEKMKSDTLSSDLLEITKSYKFLFENSGAMIDGKFVTAKTKPDSKTVKKYITLHDLMEKESVDERFILKEELFDKFKYMKGAKKEERTTKDGFTYFYTEGPVPFPDLTNRAARTILTSEFSNNRSTHIVEDITSGKLRKLTPIEAERINGFPDDWTKTPTMPEKFRYFCMGNALMVDLVKKMADGITEIVNNEKAK
jgi:DNA (cytosine-5)-methyltransferase 1